MVENSSDPKDVRASDVKDAERQANGIPHTSSSQPAVLPVAPGALVPTFAASNKTQIHLEEQYRPVDPEKGDVLARPFHQLPPPYSNDGPNARADFEAAIELTGYGKFHYILLGICGLVSTSEEMDVISMSFILPSAQCDLDLNTHTKGWLNCIIFIGEFVELSDCVLLIQFSLSLCRHDGRCLRMGIARRFLGTQAHSHRHFIHECALHRRLVILTEL